MTTVFTHRRQNGEIVRLCHHDRSLVLLDVTRGFPRPMPKVEIVPEITADLERIRREHADNE